MNPLALLLAAATLTTAADLGRAIERYAPAGRTFDLTVRILRPPMYERGGFYARDASGAIELNTFPGDWRAVRAGDVFRLTGVTSNLIHRAGVVHADCERAEFLRHEDGTRPVRTDAAAFLSGRHMHEIVSLEGSIQDVFRDEIDPKYVSFILDCGGERILAVMRVDGSEPDGLSGLRGARAVLTGACSRDADSRLYCDAFLLLASPEDIAVIRRTEDDPFDARDISDTAMMTPREISVLGRRRAVVSVLATWPARRALVRTAERWPMMVSFSDDRLPAPGREVELSGYPETDLYAVNLTRAVWRATNNAFVGVGAAIETTPTALSEDEGGRPRLAAKLHGKRIALTGTVRDLRSGKSGETLFTLEEGRHRVDVVLTTRHPDGAIPEGSRVAVSGICVMEKEPWRPNVIMPRISNIFVVVNDGTDLRILSRPPWWTPGRLLSLVAALLVCVAGIFIWNMILRRIVQRRSRQLLRTEIEKIDAQLRIDERTRLAAELHDSVAQNLSGISLQIDAAERLVDGDRQALAGRLHLASVSLKSCRDELRNCLWDLRSRALDEPDMNAAVRETLAPILGEAQLTVRFNVRRALVSDKTAHAALRIIRELASNAVRHGGATQLHVAGGLDRRRILFSVRDNGCGFDPTRVPGMRQGHFGLAGVRERVRKLNGTVEIASSPGKGTKFTISLEVATQDAP